MARCLAINFVFPISIKAYTKELEDFGYKELKS